MKIRNPKSEGRKKAESRSPKSEKATCTRVLPALFSDFGLWISAFFRLSAFGFRVFLVCLLAPASLLADTNGILLDRIPPLRPPQGELPPGIWEQYGFGLVLAGILLLALIGVAVWLLTRRRPPVVTPLAVRARRALEPLRQQPEDGAVLSWVSLILRWYAAEAFGLPPEERTTAEFCRAIAGRPQVGPELAAALSDFLRQCDERKFALTQPAPPLGAVARAEQLIDQSEVRLAALAAQAASASGPPSGDPGEMKSETRNPKPERGPKPETRNPKRQLALACSRPCFRISGFGYRPSFGFRISDFGFPVCPQ